MNRIIPFSEVLKEAMEYTGNDNKSLERLLKKNGINNIDFRRISEYMNGQFTPPYAKAKNIMDVLEYSMSEKELVDSLEANKAYIKGLNAYKNDKNPEYRISLRLKLRKILPKKEPEYVQFMLEKRIIELYGQEGKLSIYIHDLIATDLRRYILEREDINNQ